MSEKLPVVTIVGRQNVGKSTLFNALIKKRHAIVDPHPGLTRDILQFSMSHNSYSFKISDTPGLDLPGSSELSAPILENAKNYLQKSSVIIFLMETPGPESFDMDLADMIRKLSVPVIVAVNKIDDKKKLENLTNFYEMGFNDIIPISALNRFNISMLLDNITGHLSVKKELKNEIDIKIAIVGRPNSGKSTLLNSFLGYNRSVISDIPGTTRDSIDESFKFQGKTILVIDTAGIRRKRKITENIEYYSFTRSVEAIKKCDVVIHLIDAEIGLSETDKKISDEILKVNKPIVIAINKWDLIEKDHKTFQEFKDRLIYKFYRAVDFPIVSISAEKKIRINKIIIKAMELKEKAGKKISTPVLNNIISRLQKKGKIPQLGQKLKVYYAAQTDTIPPRFKLFVNNPELFRKDVIRYFEKNLQKELQLEGIPIIIHIEGKKK